MPARAPIVEDKVAARLAALGQRIRDERKRQKVSAADAAEAAGVSRVTWHRIEQGQVSVTMGAYMNALAALGLELDVLPLHRQVATDERGLAVARPSC
jgi:transcriptional regulator with XRE-family HTH domain